MLIAPTRPALGSAEQWYAHLCASVKLLDFHTSHTCAQARICYTPRNMTPKKPSKRKKTLTISEMARMGGKATAKKLTPEERKESASKAAKARWAKEKKEGSHGS